MEDCPICLSPIENIPELFSDEPESEVFIHTNMVCGLSHAVHTECQLQYITEHEILHGREIIRCVTCRDVLGTPIQCRDILLHNTLFWDCIKFSKNVFLSYLFARTMFLAGLFIISLAKTLYYKYCL